MPQHSVSCSHAVRPGGIYGDRNVNGGIHALISRGFSSVMHKSTDWSGTLSRLLAAKLLHQISLSPGALQEHKHEIFNSSIFIQPWLGLAAGCIWNFFFFFLPLWFVLLTQRGIMKKCASSRVMMGCQRISGLRSSLYGIKCSQPQDVLSLSEMLFLR